MSLSRIRTYSIVVTLGLILLMFILQYFHQYQLQTSVTRSHNISRLNTQIKLFDALLYSLQKLQKAENDVEYEDGLEQLTQLRNELAESHLSLLAEVEDYKNVGMLDPVVHIEHYLTIFVALLAESEKKNLTKAQLTEYIEQVTPIYQEYQYEIHQTIKHYSQESNRLLEHYRDLSWLMMWAALVGVITISMSFYCFISSFIKSRLQLIQENSSLLRQDNENRRRNEIILANKTNEIAAEKTRLKAVLESTVDAIITISIEGKIESFNSAAENIFGYYAEQVIGKKINMLMPEPYAFEHDDYIKRYIQTQEKRVIGRHRVLQGLRVDGSTFPIELTVTELPGIEPKVFTGIVRDITEWQESDKKLRKTMQDLRESQDLIAQEAMFAAQVFNNITNVHTHRVPGMAMWSVPMGVFSGDLILSTYLPSGAVRILLCDFTGHGLPAALGAVPLSTIHVAMAKKELPLEMLMMELNQRLKELLPTGLFCCIAGVDIDKDRTKARIWNAGLPDVLIVSGDGQLKHRASSRFLPLSIMKYNEADIFAEEVELASDDAIYIYSDGVTEAENDSGEIYGQTKFETLLMTTMPTEGRIENVKNALTSYIDKAEASDDISLIELKSAGN